MINFFLWYIRPTLNSAKDAESSKRKRLYDMSIIYPPSLLSVSPLKILLAHWTSPFSISDSGANGSGPLHSSGNATNSCPVYLLKTAQDMFGCEVKESEFSIPPVFQSAYKDSSLGQQQVCIELVSYPMYTWHSVVCFNLALSSVS